MEEENCFSSDDSNHPRSSKRMKTLEDEDRISNLPQVLILHVLSLLPSTKDAVRTSILSKNWQYHWTSITVLDFEEGRDIRSHASSWNDSNRFVFCVNHALLLNQALKIEKFRLSMICNDPSYVDVWLLLLATRKHLEMLDLHFLARYKLPISMFSNNYSLITLKLTNCGIYHDTHINWKSLVVLYLCKISLRDGLIEEMLLGCRRLEVLEMHDCWNYKALDIKSGTLRKLAIGGRYSSDVLDDRLPTRINAPHLQSLVISGYLYEYMIINLSSVAEVKLNFCNRRIPSVPVTSEHTKILAELFENLRQVKDLTVGSMCLQVLSTWDDKSMSYPFSNVVCLTVHITLYEKEVHGLTRLLRYNPLMEMLIINMSSMIWNVTKSSKCDDHDEDNNYWSSPKNSLLNLKTIRIIGFGATESETEVLFFLLRNSYVLKKMTIHARNHAGLKSTLDITQRLLNFPRCSENAVVVFD